MQNSLRSRRHRAQSLIRPNVLLRQRHFALGCARAASGKAVTEQKMPLSKSRRRVASPKASGTTPIALSRQRLKQGYLAGETAFSGHFARQQFCDAEVRFGSIATDAVELADRLMSASLQKRPKFPIAAK